MELKCEIVQFKNNCFALIIDNTYDRAMSFCRYQEFYESPNSKFRNKSFSIWDYMAWYSKKHKKGFSYGADWEGFNLPVFVFKECNSKNLPESPYDFFMRKVLEEVYSMSQNPEKAYLMGVKNITDSLFKHEFCHALWGSKPKYKKEAKQVLHTIPKQDFNNLKNNLIEAGYNKKVVEDEIHAYLMFGWSRAFFKTNVDSEKLKIYSKRMHKALNKYLKMEYDVVERKKLSFTV